MVELERTMDVVRLSVMRSVLSDAGIDSFVFDSAAGGLLTGAIPSRLMVREEDLELARLALKQAGL
ncbi:MAG: putative prokaryotic signal transducing protein [Caulobacteraceae bacterium]|jgi:hypothetical protein|nr:putative prokaryotic signal transducing protein [Caulobacteraceae bacterium]